VGPRGAGAIARIGYSFLIAAFTFPANSGVILSMPWAVGAPTAQRRMAASSECSSASG